jgi:tRNA A37 methylthiotransferase MiaB
MAGEKRICEILCPIQSGSDRLLKLMDRHHGMEELKNILLEFKRVNPHLRLTTHAIIGFPSETEEDLLATLSAIQEIRFDHVVLFPYYDGQDTIASRLGGKIDKTTIHRRLEAAAKDLRAAGISVE